MIIVVASNTIYNISSKSVNGDVNIYASLIVTYLVALVVTVLLCWVTGGLALITL